MNDLYTTTQHIQFNRKLSLMIFEIFDTSNVIFNDILSLMNDILAMVCDIPAFMSDISAFMNKIFQQS